jgi:hypothetical protein
MIVKRNNWNVLIIVIALVFAAECALSTGEDVIPEVYSYTVDEFQGGIFNSMSPELTMNNWFLKTFPYFSNNYDSWSNNQKVFLYKDDKLKTPFTGSDLINEDTVLYSESSFNGQGKKTGQITGTITLTDIPSPGTKVQIRTSSYSKYPDNWWDLNKEINMSSVTGTSATLSWSLPVYEKLKPNSEGTFELIVLPGNSMNTYTAAVPNKISLKNNKDVGNVGTISIKGVTLSGTININYGGNPVPYLELYAIYDVQDLLNITCISSPEQNAQWSLTYGKNRNDNVDIKFQILGYSEKNKNNMLFDIFVRDFIININNNQDKSGIVIDIGDTNNY